MNKLTTALAVALVSSVSAVVIPSLTKENYDVITDGKIVFIKFFAPWCGHCKNLKPEYEKLAEDWADSEMALIAEVDCTAEGQSLCEEQDIQGYPTLKYGDPEFLEIYSGAWKYSEMSPFTKEHLKPSCTPKKLDLCDPEKKKQIESLLAMSTAELDKLIDGKELLIKEAEQKFDKGVKGLDETHTQMKKVKDDKVEDIMEKGLRLMKSVQQHRGILPRTLPSLTEENFDSLTEGKTVFLKFFAPWCGHCKAMANDWKKLWKIWDNSKTGFVAEVDCTSDDSQALCEKYKVQGYPTLMYGNLTLSSELKTYDGGRSFDELSAFAEQNLKPKEPTAVVNLTPDNYDSLTNGKTIFVKFFAPWCGYCKKMAPAWEQLAKEWVDDKIGLIGEVDCTTGEGTVMCDKHKIEGYPTIKYGDPAALEKYPGNYDFDSLNEFAKENLKPICTPGNIQSCDGEAKEKIEKFMSLSLEKLDILIEKEEQKLKDASDKFDEEVQKLQEKHNKVSGDKDNAIAFIKEQGLSMMKQVADYRGVTPKPVPSLTSENFDSMTEGKYVFIKYFAPWCYHCKKMAAAWTRLYQDYVDSDTHLIAEVDCTTEVELCKDIENYPTLFYGEPKALERYKGGRDYDTLSGFAKQYLKYIPPSAVHKLTAENYVEKTNGKTVFIKFFAPWCGYCKQMAPHWEKLGHEWANKTFALIAEVDCTTEGKMCDEQNIQGYPTVKYGDPGDLDDYYGMKEFDQLSSFAKENLKPLCSMSQMHRCNETQVKLLKKYFAMSDDEIDELIQTQEQKLKDSIEKYKKGIADLDAVREQLQIDEKNEIAWIKEQGLNLMMAVYEHRGLAPKPVIQLTPENYDSMTEGKWVFIKYFAPWCGFCQKMAKDFLKLSQKYEDSETILIAEVDCTEEANEPLCKEHGIERYPTIKFGDPKNDKYYNYPRTVDEMAAFVERKPMK